MTYAQPASAARNHLIARRAEDPDAAARLYKRFADAAARLGHFPNLGRAGHEPGTRELVIAGTPYLFIYRVDPNAVMILDIQHTARKPS